MASHALQVSLTRDDSCVSTESIVTIGVSLASQSECLSVKGAKATNLTNATSSLLFLREDGLHFGFLLTVDQLSIIEQVFLTEHLVDTVRLQLR